VARGSSLYMGTAALSERDFVHKAIDRADLILSIGHDTVEKPPFLMGPTGPKVIHIGYVPATVEEVFAPQTEVIGDVGPRLALLADRLKGKLPNRTRQYLDFPILCGPMLIPDGRSAIAERFVLSGERGRW
jgi:acetolactate synthase-1/2/3 large subunit